MVMRSRKTGLFGNKPFFSMGAQNWLVRQQAFFLNGRAKLALVRPQAFVS
jgi:hypothetical protein